jgi:hypothetical protein
MENTIKNVKLLQFGVKNLNGRVYPEHAVEFSESGAVTSVPDNSSIIGFYSNAKVEDGHLVCDITVEHGVFSNLAKLDLIDFATAGVGELDSKGVVSNYTMSSVFVVPKGSKA